MMYLTLSCSLRDRGEGSIVTHSMILSVVDCTEKRDAWFVSLKVKRMRLRFKIDTGADVTVITKKTWLGMKDKPRHEPSVSTVLADS